VGVGDVGSDEARRLAVRTRLDADQARREARRLAADLGFGLADAESVALAVSELAMNLHRYAAGGEIVLRAVSDGDRRGVEIESQDSGPGIADPGLAFEDGYTTSGGLGSGLPSARRLMDVLTLTTGPAGTRIVARKWLPGRS
jgi:serine/threonine-protein kinase RsbT